jgi:hypothetical protein
MKTLGSTVRYKACSYEGREAVQQALARNMPDELGRVVIGVGLCQDDPSWAEAFCIRLAEHQDAYDRGNAILRFGHLARRFRRLEQSRVQPLIEAALKDPGDDVRNQADAAATDVEFFLGWKLAR